MDPTGAVTLLAAEAAETASPLLTELAILILAAFVGFQVISKVPNTLHTPLMSGTNAIHGIVLLGGLVAIAHGAGVLNKVILVIAIAFGTINIVGGFLVTDRMLGMFKRKPEPAAEKTDERETAKPEQAAAAAPEREDDAAAAEQDAPASANGKPRQAAEEPEA